MEGNICVLIKGKMYEGILENGSFKTDNGKLCRNCGRMKLFDEFNKDNKQCRQCTENKRNNRIKHKDRYNEEQRKRYEEDDEYRNKTLESNRKWNSIKIQCDICDCYFSPCLKTQHLKTNKHKRNLEMKQAEEN